MGAGPLGQPTQADRGPDREGWSYACQSHATRRLGGSLAFTVVRGPRWVKGYLRTASSESKCPTTPSSTDPRVQVKLFLNILDKHTHNGPYLKNKAINLANLTTQLRKQRQKPTARTRAEPGTRNRELGTGNWEPGTGNQEPGTRNQESGTGNQEPGTRN